MKQIYEIISEVASIGSTKSKQQILEENKDNVVLRNTFFYAENPRFNYFIKVTNQKQYLDSASEDGRDLIDSDFKLLGSLIDRTVTGNDARFFIQMVAIPLNRGAREILCRIINRDLRCNCGTAIANKVWKGLIPEYPVMLASKFDAKSQKYLDQFEKTCGFVVQTKCDGGRINVFVDEAGKVTYRSRAGSELNLFGIFDKDFTDKVGYMFDGELLVEDASGIVDRKVSNGLYTKAVRGTLSKEEAAKFRMVVWDVVEIEQFNAGEGNVPYTERLLQLNDFVQSFSPSVKMVEGKQVQTVDECVKFYDFMRLHGEEGAIIRVASSVWVDGRSKNMVKMKAEESADLLCVGTEEGTGKNVGKIGNLICESSCGQLRVNVGTGFSDMARELAPSHYVGKIVEICYNEIISAKGRDSRSLFLPVFKQVRYDKINANALVDLK